MVGHGRDGRKREGREEGKRQRQRGKGRARKEGMVMVSSAGRHEERTECGVKARMCA